MRRDIDLKIPRLSPMKQIRKFCIYCCGGYRKSVLFCSDTECPLWYLRLGTKPQSVINRNGKKYVDVFNPENFKEGAKFCPHKEVSSFKLGK